MSTLPEIQEAWTARAGDVVFLRFNKTLDPDEASAYRAVADELTKKTGVQLVLLDKSVEVVNPTTGASV